MQIPTFRWISPGYTDMTKDKDILEIRKLKLNEILKNIDVPRGTNENEN